MAILLPVLFGAAAFGAEASFWTYRQRLLQQYADVAAYSAAVELLKGGTPASVRAMSESSLHKNGLRRDIGFSTTVSPPADGPFAGIPAVEVSVEEKWPRFFTAIFFKGDVSLAASATARLDSAGEACMLALDPVKSGAATLSGSADVTLKGCSLVANSLAGDALKVSGSGQLKAACAGAAGGVETTASGILLSECAGPRANMPPIKDPYEAVPAPEVRADCETLNRFGGSAKSSHTVGPGRFCGMTIQRSVMLEPGVYIIDGGDLRISSTASLQGSGVTFAFRNGARLIINGTAEIDLSGPVSGPYAGLVFLGEREGPPVRHLLNGSASASFRGAIYFPNDNLEIRGSNTSAAGCTQIIAGTLDLRGSAGAGIDCKEAGTKPLKLDGRVKLVR